MIPREQHVENQGKLNHGAKVKHLYIAHLEISIQHTCSRGAGQYRSEKVITAGLDFMKARALLYKCSQIIPAPNPYTFKVALRMTGNE